MKLSDFMSIIDHVHQHTNQVALGGRGDPNKHPKFADMLEYCRKHNVVPNYTTSGIDLTDDEIEASTMCGAVAVSDYEKDFTYDALQRLMDAGIKTNIHQIFDAKTFHKCTLLIKGIDYIICCSQWRSCIQIYQIIVFFPIILFTFYQCILKMMEKLTWMN